MPLVAGDKIEVKIFCKLTPQIGLNVRHYEVGAWPVGPTDQAVANAISLKFAPVYTPLLALPAQFFGVAVGKLTGGVFMPFASSTSGQAMGGAGFETLPAQVTGLITLRTALPGRANRGRAYIPFPSEDGSNGAAFPAPTGGYLGQLANIGVLFQQIVFTNAQLPPTGGTLLGQIFHRSGLPTFEPITSYVARAAWATQRRRGAFGEQNPDPF